MRKPALLPFAALALYAGCQDNPAGVLERSAPAAEPRLVVAGAGFTTTNPDLDGPGTCQNGPGTVNCNLYTAKEFVWANGGPNHVGPSALSDGIYFFAVLEPSGQAHSPNDGGAHNLSDTDVAGGAATAGCGTGTGCGDLHTNRMFRVSGGDIVQNLGTHDDYSTPAHGLLLRLANFDDTGNPGGVYIMALCRMGASMATLTYPVDPSQCKYDAFKAQQGAAPPGSLAGGKYYDSNRNGQWDHATEPGLQGWLIDMTDGVSDVFTTDVGGEFGAQVVADGYTLRERQPLPFTIGGGPATGYWSQTGNTTDQTADAGGNTSTLNPDKSYSVTVVDEGETTGLNFGNVCYVRPGGRTLGFWSNKNGLGLMTAADFTTLTALNLRNANGSDRDFTASLASNKTAFNAWLLSASATNMAYMLSAQMAATRMDVDHGFTDPAILVDGAMNVAALIVYGNSLLANPIAGGTFAGQNGSVTVGSGALRTEQERVKNIFDKINNNGSLGDFLQGYPNSCPIDFAP